MIDFHTHLDLYPDPLVVAEEASKRNSFTLAVTTSPRAWSATTKVLGTLPNIKIALGLHPEIVAKKELERDLLLEMVTKADFIGETGLDGSLRHRESFALQVSIFDSLLKECSNRGGRVISIHSRGAAGQVLDVLDKYPDVGIPVMHWFSGSKPELLRAIDRGCWFSFGPAGLSSKSGKSVLRDIPLEKLLPESDGPFAQYKGLTVMPWEAQAIVSEICESQNLSKDFVENQFKENLAAVLKNNV